MVTVAPTARRRRGARRLLQLLVALTLLGIALGAGGWQSITGARPAAGPLEAPLSIRVSTGVDLSGQRPADPPAAAAADELQRADESPTGGCGALPGRQRQLFADRVGAAKIRDDAPQAAPRAGSAPRAPRAPPGCVA